tara:strand:+ start:214 stop:591 length:378 start_codon:yes stop_codon:yes gene_type:complete
MKESNLNSIKSTLRLAVFLTFIGHGLLAFYGNESWLIYLETVGFSRETSKTLIVYIGIIDIIVAIIVLVKPNKYVVLWCVLWAFSTALIRPIAGEDILDFVERGANWLAPLALFFILNNKRENFI